LAGDDIPVGGDIVTGAGPMQRLRLTWLAMPKLPSLNGLRAISILIVIVYHLFHFNLGLDEDAIYRIPVLNGRFGVNVFFVISGFIITTLLLQEEKRSGAISVKNFYVRRSLRIFPAYYFLLGVYALLQLLGYISIPSPAWMTALTYTKYFNYSLEYYTTHFWSLAIEENFYLFWPLIFAAGDSVRKKVAIVLLIIPPFIRLYINYFPLDWLQEQSIFVRIDSIATGCIVALYKDKIVAKLQTRWNDVFFYSLLILFVVPWLDRIVGDTFLELIFIFFGVLTGSIANISIAAGLLYSVYGPRGSWYKLLNSKVLDYIGVLSYSLYLWQQFFMGKRDNWWFTNFPQNIVCIFLAGLFSHYIIERPFLRLKSRFSLKKSPKAAVT
jgi:peptidoglycan/LPS O-acetylase OafA/YrhL